MLCQQRVLHSIFYGKIAEERFCKWTAWMADVLSDKNVPTRIWSTFYLPPQLGQRLWPHFKLVKRVKQLCCHFLSSATMQSCSSYQIDSFYDFLLARWCWRIWLPRAVKLQRCYLDWLEMFTQAKTNAIVSHKWVKTWYLESCPFTLCALSAGGMRKWQQISHRFAQVTIVDRSGIWSDTGMVCLMWFF